MFALSNSKVSGFLKTLMKELLTKYLVNSAPCTAKYNTVHNWSYIGMYLGNL